MRYLQAKCCSSFVYMTGANYAFWICDISNVWWNCCMSVVLVIWPSTKFMLPILLHLLYVADILNLISMQHFKSRKALFNNHSFTAWFQSNLEFIKRFAITFSKWVICYTSSHNSRYLIDKKYKLCRGPYNEYYWHATTTRFFYF
jgi:hypothetical protein